jgi:uncharacterized protein YprB with RNaseH-like and TPR domain
VWSLWNQNISLNQLIESSYTLCLGWKWYGEKGRVNVVRTADVPATAAHLLDEADAVVHYNGKSFDIPILQKDILLSGGLPPSPFRQIDLYSVVKRQFRFPSSKLAYVSEALGLEGKVKHPGHEMWIGCMSGDEKSWKTMERYNRRDVVLLEELYDRLLPWIPSHPNRRLYGGDGCPKCSGELAPRGYAYTNTGKYRRSRCRDCGAWSRDTRRIEGTGIVSL